MKMPRSGLLSGLFLGCLTAVILGLPLACTTTGRIGHAPIYLIKIEKGDTLAAIAAKYDTSWQSIARLNRLDSESHLVVGKILRVQPGPGGLVASSSKRLAGKLPRKVRSARYSDDELPNRPASELSKFQEEDYDGSTPLKSAVSSRVDGDEEAPAKKRHGLLFQSGSTSGGDSVAWPIVGDLSSHFGSRGSHFHKGIDIRSPYGSDIRAAASGRVIFEGRQHGYGKTIIVQHNGFQTLYAHCSDILVDEGDMVNQGDRIGRVGVTGNSSGPHLHFEVRRRGVAIDPLGFLPASRYLSKSSLRAAKDEGNG